ncbi:hypothetical protein DW196_02260 [Vagococcus sp. AM17-17]|nr:hypothetical protein DW196_02260 [Vagococcus sp. AM17-17]
MLIEKDGYVKETAESEKIKEHNELLRSQIAGYETILDEKQQLERKLLEINHTKEENSILKDENGKLKAILEEKDQQLSSVELEVKNKDEEIIDQVNELELANSKLKEITDSESTRVSKIEEL